MELCTCKSQALAPDAAPRRSKNGRDGCDHLSSIARPLPEAPQYLLCLVVVLVARQIWIAVSQLHRVMLEEKLGHPGDEGIVVLFRRPFRHGEPATP